MSKLVLELDETLRWALKKYAMDNCTTMRAVATKAIELAIRPQEQIEQHVAEQKAAIRVAQAVVAATDAINETPAEEKPKPPLRGADW